MPLDRAELKSRVKKLRKSLKGFPSNPTVDEVHDLRTRTRRVESILHGLELDSSGSDAKLLAGLKPIRKRAGKVRDMDVLTSHIVGLGTNDDPNCVVRLVHHLGNKRERQADRLHDTVHRNAAELRARLKKAQRKLGSVVDSFAKSRFELDGRGSEQAPLHAMSTALLLSKELAGVRRLGRNNLHAYRIQVKRLRYVLEMASSDSGPEHEFVDELKTVQDAIGEWHDWLQLTDIAHDVLQGDSDCKLLKMIQQTGERKFGDAMRVTEEMRQHYLDTGAHQGKSSKRRSRQKQPLSRPVLRAAAEIAA